MTLAIGTAACDKVPLLAPTGSSISLFAASDAVPLNGSTTITATVLEASGTPVHNGTLVTFTTTLGSLDPAEARTTNGSATVRFNAGSQSGTATIQAFSGGTKTSGGTTTSTTSAPSSLTGSAVQIRVGAAVVESVQLVASPANLPSTGGTTQLTATVLDASGNAVTGVPVTFTTSIGTLSAQSAVTDGAGQARTSLTATREAKVTARAGAKTSAEVTVSVNAAPSLTVQANPQAVVVSQPTTVTITPGSTSGALKDARVDFGDGDSRQLGTINSATSLTHTYCSPNGYVVSASGTDVNGERASSSAGISVTPLVVSLAVSGTARTNLPVVFTATPIAGAIVTRYEWDFFDGQRATTFGPTVAHTFQQVGGYEVKVTAFGQTCGTATAQIGVSVTP